MLVDGESDLRELTTTLADVYGLDWGGSAFGSCEEALGRLLTRQPGLRERIVLATKGGIIPGQPYDSTSRHLIEACEAVMSSKDLNRRRWLHPEIERKLRSVLKQAGRPPCE